MTFLLPCTKLGERMGGGSEERSEIYFRWLASSFTCGSSWGNCGCLQVYTFIYIYYIRKYVLVVWRERSKLGDFCQIASTCVEWVPPPLPRRRRVAAAGMLPTSPEHRRQGQGRGPRGAQTRNRQP